MALNIRHAAAREPNIRIIAAENTSAPLSRPPAAPIITINAPITQAPLITSAVSGRVKKSHIPERKVSNSDAIAEKNANTLSRNVSRA